MSVDLHPNDIAYFRRGDHENPAFWRRLGGVPPLRGKKVLDVGCGLGSLCVSVAQLGAEKVVGVDYERRLVEFAAEHVRRMCPHVADVLMFHDVELKHLDEDGFDVILSKDTFEHMMDLPHALLEMKKRLKPGGRIYAGFGPLYNSPFGHHGRVHTFLPWRRFPWGHLLESEDRMVARMNRVRARGGDVFSYSDEPLRTIRDLGLNMYTFAEYRGVIDASGFDVVRFAVNQGEHRLLPLLSAIRRVPLLEEYFTINVYCILERPG